MAFRNKAMTMPSIDDIIMQIMAMSEAIYNGEYSIGRSLYDENRPAGWPTADYLLKFFGYAQSSAGWAALIDDHIGVECKTFTEIMRDNGEDRMQRRWQTEDKPDYSASPDERYQALFSVTGYAVCENIYRETGRMVLR
jgi:hypothetical protein